MSIEVKMNLGAINEALQKNAKATRVSASAVLRFEMGSIASALTKYTPPSKHFSKATGADKTIGNKAIDRDMNKLFFVIGKKALGMVARQNNPRLVVVSGHGQMATFHNSKKRNGTVKFKPAKVMTMGKWELTDQMYAMKQQVTSYAKKVKESVGKLKAGWIPAIKAFGAKMPLSWISRHAGKGYAIQRLDEQKFSGYLGAANSTPYADIIRRKQIIPFVVNMHQKIIDEKIKNVVGNAVRRFNSISISPSQSLKVA